MKYLVIPDVHNHIGTPEELIKHFPEHQVVFLGDYFDSYHDIPELARETAHWLRHSINAGRIHLMGNHDLAYRWQQLNQFYEKCPGWTLEKHREINNIIRPTDWAQVRLSLPVKPPSGFRPLVLSHAGFTLANLYGVADFRDVAKGGRCRHLRNRTVKEHLEEIESGTDNCLKAVLNHTPHFWFNQGDRMGEIETGGPFWIDKDSFHAPLPGIDQIVGHSHVKAPMRAGCPNQAKPESEVWFIDGGGQFAALVEGGVNEVGGLHVEPIYARGPNIGQHWSHFKQL